MKVSIALGATAPDRAREWAGTIFVADWGELGEFLEELSKEFDRVLISNMHGVVSLEIQR